MVHNGGWVEVAVGGFVPSTQARYGRRIEMIV